MKVLFEWLMLYVFKPNSFAEEHSYLIKPNVKTIELYFLIHGWFYVYASEKLHFYRNENNGGIIQKIYLHIK
jgi:hypothetical protein